VSQPYFQPLSSSKVVIYVSKAQPSSKATCLLAFEHEI
jgi:hypothetical protein